MLEAQGHSMADVREHCPECFESGMKSELKRMQYKENEYIVLCMNEECAYSEIIQGYRKFTKEEVAQYGLPVELLDYMELYEEDMNKIITICLYDYYKSYFRRVQSELVESEIKELESASDILKNVSCENFDQFTQTVSPTIASISIEYKIKVREAFSKIKNYNYPNDFVLSYLKKDKNVLSTEGGITNTSKI